jgi:hypothetical protein
VVLSGYRAVFFALLPTTSFFQATQDRFPGPVQKRPAPSELCRFEGFSSAATQYKQPTA